MTPYTHASNALADRLRAGEHEFYNQHLRQVYGLSRVTVKARGEIAAALERAGLEILSDATSEPLVVRKLARVREPRQARPPRRGRRNRWAVAFVSLLVLFVVVGVLSSEEPTAAPDSPPAQEQAQGQSPSADAVPTPEATAAPQTLSDARAAVREDDYGHALVIAAVLGDDATRGISRRISRRLAYRATRALRTNRRTASQLLREASDYPSTPELRKARRALRAAQARARARAAAKRQAQAAARHQRELRAQARRQARAEARQRAEATNVPTSPSAPNSSSAPEPSGPSTTNWCGKRDGDGDGIYCEGL